MSKISTGTLLNTGFVVTSDTSGNLVVQTGATGNTAVVIDANGTVNFGYTTNFSSPLALNGGTANGVAYLNTSKVLTTGSEMTFNGTTLVAPDITDSGNLTFTGTGKHILGDMRTGIVPSSRLLIKTSIGTSSDLGIIPNATSGAEAAYTTYSSSNPDNASAFTFGISTGGLARINSTITGTGTYLPMTFQTGGSERVRIDTAGNLGIGTSSPSQKFHVVGNALFTPSTWGTSGNSAVYLGDTNNYVLTTFGGATTLAGYNDITFGNTQSGFVERMRITAGGNVGIGNNNPDHPLDVTSAADSIAIEIRGRSADNVGAIVFDNNTSNAGSQVNYIQSVPNGHLSIGTNNTDRVRVTAAGNVGVGTSLPSARLDTNNSDAADTVPLAISNNIGGTDAATSGINFNAHNVNFARIVGGQQTSGTFADGNLRFLTRNAETVAEKMRITPAGNVGIGTNAPAAKLTVAGSFAVGGIRIQDTDASQAAPALEIIGQRLDGNGSVSFSGKALLARHHTGAAISNAINLGGVLFGGNHTSSSASNILYSASITGVSEGTFSSSSSMPTGLAFLTGFPGISPDTANASAGTERMRIDSIGNIQMGNASAADTAGRFFDIYNTGTSAGAYSIMRLITQQVDSTATTSVDFVKYKNGVLAINNNDTNSATCIAFGVGASERMRIRSNGSTSYSGGQLVQNYYQTGSITPTSTKWWRICTFAATNQTQYVEFLFTIPGVHLIMKAKFSKSTSGGYAGGGVLEVEQLGSYVYWNYYPFDWRLVDQGTNSPSHIDIRFPHNTGESFDYRIQVLNSWSADAPQHATFPITDMGTGTTGSRYVNMGSNMAGWTKQSFKMTGANYAYYDTNLSLFSGQTPPTA